MNLPHATCGAAFVSLVLACLGCGADSVDIAPVEGTVTMDGEPLPYASVLFITGTGRPAGGSTDEQGRYFLTFTQGRRGAMLGKNMVRISTVRDPGETAEGKSFPGSGEMVPAMYNVYTTLDFVVEAGKTNIANFDLDSSGPLPNEDEDAEAGQPEPGDASAAPELGGTTPSSAAADEARASADQ